VLDDLGRRNVGRDFLPAGTPSGQKTETKRKFGGKLVLDDLDWRNVGRDLLPAGTRKAEVGSRGRCMRGRRVPRAQLLRRFVRKVKWREVK